MKKSIIAILCCVLMVTMCGCRTVRNVVNGHQWRGDYRVLRINSDANLCKNDKNYFYTNKGGICRYSFEDEKEEYLDLESIDISDFTVCGSWIYYVKHNKDECEMRRMNYISSEDEQILSYKELQLFDEEVVEKTVALDTYKDYLVWGIGKNEWKIYVCPIGENLMTDSISLNELCDANKKNDKEQEIQYAGIAMNRYYNPETGFFEINSIREAETGLEILFDRMQVYIKVDGKEYSFRKEPYTSEFYYQSEGETQQHIITCLQKDKYKYSDIYEERLTVENGEIIGIMSVSQDSRVSLELDQGMLENDVLFKLNPKTGESEILYEPRNNRTRIIGYQDGIMYLFRNHKVYSQLVGEKKRTELCSLPEGDYIFDWQGGYLIALKEDIGEKEVFVVCKVE